MMLQICESRIRTGATTASGKRSSEKVVVLSSNRSERKAINAGVSVAAGGVRL